MKNEDFEGSVLRKVPFASLKKNEPAEERKSGGEWI
jgi:hypothetical protein